MRSEQLRSIRTLNVIYLVGWVLIPLGIAILGFANWWVGFVLFVLSLLKIVWKLVEVFGDPGKWLPGYKGKMDRKRLEKHWIYHCERNPEGFARLKNENFDRAE